MNDLLILQIETTNHCNGKCVFCPHDRLKEKGFMEDGLFGKIIEEASKLPNLKMIDPFLTGEPFLDSKFMERLRIIRSSLPEVVIEIYTNGSLLNEDIIKQLSVISKLKLNVSLNGWSAETRKKVMGLDDFDHVIQMITLLQENGILTRTSMVDHPDISREEEYKFIGHGGMLIRNQSWAGLQFPHERRRWTCCPRATCYMTVLYTGVVCLCCFDPFGEVDFGNLKDQSIEEIWTSKRRREYQSIHRQGKGNELPKCEACTEG